MKLGTSCFPSLLITLGIFHRVSSNSIDYATAKGEHVLSEVNPASKNHNSQDIFTNVEEIEGLEHFKVEDLVSDIFSFKVEESVLNPLFIAPSTQPSISSRPSGIPSSEPTNLSSTVPSLSPTTAPSISPSATPSSVPSEGPTYYPSSMPSISLSPSSFPTSQPSHSPTTTSSSSPSSEPTSFPSLLPSLSPVLNPSTIPTFSPSIQPSLEPTTYPSFIPSVTPTMTPTSEPTNFPSTTPSLSPTVHSSTAPSYPTESPSMSFEPSQSPSSSMLPASDEVIGKIVGKNSFTNRKKGSTTLIMAPLLVALVVGVGGFSYCYCKRRKQRIARDDGDDILEDAYSDNGSYGMTISKAEEDEFTI